MTQLLTIENNHFDDCGKPPVVSPDDYVGYFQNSFGEQWIFTFDRQTRTGTLYGGDIGWDEPCKVVGGLVMEVFLRQPEALWLQACWIAATGNQIGAIQSQTAPRRRSTDVATAPQFPKN